MKLKKLLNNLGWDGLLLTIAGGIALILGLLDFTPLINLTSDPAQKIILSGIGLLLGAIATQTASRKAEIEELKKSIGIADSYITTDNKEIGQLLYLEVIKAKRYINNTLLNTNSPSLKIGYGFSGSQAEAHTAIYRRVTKDEIEFRHTVVIFHPQMLQDVIFKLLLHEGYKFFVRYYSAPPNAIPLLNITSFDNEKFILGNYHIVGSANYTKRLIISEPGLSELMKNFWSVHWESAKPLNEGRIINWSELRNIGTGLGLSNDDFDKLVETVKADIQRVKRQNRL